VTESGVAVTLSRMTACAEMLNRTIATAPPAGRNTLIVTHKPNILDVLGKDWFGIKEGEASFFRVDASGKPQLVARVQVVDWIRAADE